MDKDTESILAGLGVIALIVAMMLYGVIVGGWVVSWLWEWFIVPLFPVPSLTIFQACGVAYVLK